MYASPYGKYEQFSGTSTGKAARGDTSQPGRASGSGLAKYLGRSRQEPRISRGSDGGGGGESLVAEEDVRRGKTRRHVGRVCMCTCISQYTSVVCTLNIVFSQAPPKGGRLPATYVRTYVGCHCTTARHDDIPRRREPVEDGRNTAQSIHLLDSREAGRRARLTP